jgi:hypothetical protein
MSDFAPLCALKAVGATNSVEPCVAGLRVWRPRLQGGIRDPNLAVTSLERFNARDRTHGFLTVSVSNSSSGGGRQLDEASTT